MAFIDLPAELRCIIYGHLFADLVNPHGLRPDLYRLPEDWPKNNFATYLALIRTCKLVNKEAVPYFEKHFLPGLILHFDTVAALHTTAKSLPLTPAYADVRFVLVTQAELFCRRHSPCQNPIFRDFLELQPGGEHLLDLNWYGHTKFQAKRAGLYVCNGCGINLDVAAQGRAGSLVHSYGYAGSKGSLSGEMRLVMRGIWNEEGKEVARQSWYYELAGRMRDLEWSGWVDEERSDEGCGGLEDEEEVERRVEMLRRWVE